MISGKSRLRSERRLAVFALAAAALLLPAGPAFASPVAGDRYEGVYTVPGIPFNTLAPDAPFDPTEAVNPVNRLIGDLRNCRKPGRTTPEINFQVNRSGRRAGFFTRFTATDDQTDQSINITLEDASPPIDDDLGITRGGDIDPPAEDFDLSGKVPLPDGRMADVMPGSKLFVRGGFNVQQLNRSACGRPTAEVVYGSIGALIAVEGPNGGLQLFDSNISPFGGFACRVSFCDRAPGPTAQGRSSRSELRDGTASPIRVVKRGARTGGRPSPVAAAAERMGRALTLTR